MSIAAIFKEAKKIDISSDDVADMIRRIRQVDDPATATDLKDRIVMANVRMIQSVIDPYRKIQSLSEEDMFNEGVFGIYDAIDKFDFGRNAKFSTYAYWLIRKKITQYVRGVMFNNVDRRSISIEKPVGDADGSRTVGDTLHAASDVYSELGGTENSAIIEKAMSALTPREQIVIRLRFGLGTAVQNSLPGKP